MKTKDLIKMLQEEDPAGEGYVRVSGGAIVWAESKEGYWDGKYQYYDKETRTLHISSEGYKIDIITYDVNDIIWEEEGIMENIKPRLHPHFENFLHKEDNYERFWKGVEKEAEECREFMIKLRKGTLDEVLEKYKEGWVCRTPDTEDIYKLKESKERGYKVLKYQLQWKKGFKTKTMCRGEVEAFELNENLFDKVKKGKYIYFKLKK